MHDVFRLWYWKENIGSANWQQLQLNTRNGECFTATSSWVGQPKIATTWYVFYNCCVLTVETNQLRKPGILQEQDLLSWDHGCLK
jgi:hypothetical protein